METLLHRALYYEDINYELLIQKLSSNDFVKEIFKSKTKEELALEYLNTQHKSFIHYTSLFKDFYSESLNLINSNPTLTNHYYSNNNFIFIVEYQNLDNFDMDEFMDLIFTDFTLHHFGFFKEFFNDFFEFLQVNNKITIMYKPNFYEVSYAYENDMKNHSNTLEKWFKI